MSTKTFRRSDLEAHGVEPHHTHVCTLLRPSGQGELVLGFGDDEDSAHDEALREIKNAGLEVAEGSEFWVYAID